MADCVKQPLDNMLKTCNFSFYIDDTTGITSTEQFTVCTVLLWQFSIRALIPVSKVLWSSLSAPNVMEALEQFFIKRHISLWGAKFASMDTTNVNSGEKGGLKLYFEHRVPLLHWVGCNSHKVAFIFQAFNFSSFVHRWNHCVLVKLVATF